MVFGIRMKTELWGSSLFLMKSLKAFVGERKRSTWNRIDTNISHGSKTAVRCITQIAVPVTVSLSTKHSIFLSSSFSELSRGNVLYHKTRSQTKPGICLTELPSSPTVRPHNWYPQRTALLNRSNSSLPVLYSAFSHLCTYSRKPV